MAGSIRRTHNAGGRRLINTPGRPWDWRGPPVGGVCLRKATDSSQTATAVPMPTRPSIRCGRLKKCALPTILAQRTFQQRSQTANALKSSWYKTNIERAGALSPMMDGSNSSLQARSPCTTAAALCLPVAIPAYMMPSAPILAHASMHS